MATKDYPVLQFQDAALVRQVLVYSRSPLVLDLRGQHFIGVSEVRINGRPVPEFMVLTPSRILAPVPTRVVGTRIRSVRVILAREGLTQTTKIRFRASVPGGRGTGFSRLLQSFLRLLFTATGEDLDDFTRGGGMGKIVGAAGDPGALRSGVVRSVRDTESQMIRLQAGNTRLQDSEKLQSATVVSAEFIPSLAAVHLQLRLTAMDGSTHDPVLSI